MTISTTVNTKIEHFTTRIRSLYHSREATFNSRKVTHVGLTEVVGMVQRVVPTPGTVPLLAGGRGAVEGGDWEMWPS